MGEDFLRFYNMSRNPFSKSLPTDMAHPTEDLRQVHARLSHLARTGGIGLVTADPGTGKTFAVRTWAERLNPNTNRLVYLCLSTVTNMEFYRELCQGLGVEPCFKKTDMFRDIQACVRSLVEERRQRVTLVVDEAHYLQTSVLRDLQMLTNFEMKCNSLHFCSNTWRTRSVRKRFMVMWSSGLMPQIQRNPTFSLVARAMARLE